MPGRVATGSAAGLWQLGGRDSEAAGLGHDLEGRARVDEIPREILYEVETPRRCCHEVCDRQRSTDAKAHGVIVDQRAIHFPPGEKRSIFFPRLICLSSLKIHHLPLPLFLSHRLAIGHMTPGRATSNLIDVRDLIITLLHYDPTAKGTPYVPLRGFVGSQVPWGVKWGGTKQILNHPFKQSTVGSLQYQNHTTV